MRGSARLWRKTIGVSLLGVDTNVLVRFLTDDDAVQSPMAISLRTHAANHPIYVGTGVLVEVYLVLARVKKLPRVDIHNAFAMLLNSPAFIVENAVPVARALGEAVDGNFDFNDALFSVLHANAGCVATATFDRKAQGLAGMIAVEDRI